MNENVAGSSALKFSDVQFAPEQEADLTLVENQYPPENDAKALADIYSGNQFGEVNLGYAYPGPSDSDRKFEDAYIPTNKEHGTSDRDFAQETQAIYLGIDQSLLSDSRFIGGDFHIGKYYFIEYFLFDPHQPLPQTPEEINQVRQALLNTYGAEPEAALKRANDQTILEMIKQKREQRLHGYSEVELAKLNAKYETLLEHTREYQLAIYQEALNTLPYLNELETILQALSMLDVQAFVDETKPNEFELKGGAIQRTRAKFTPQDPEYEREVDRQTRIAEELYTVDKKTTNPKQRQQKLAESLTSSLDQLMKKILRYYSSFNPYYLAVSADLEGMEDRKVRDESLESLLDSLELVPPIDPRLPIIFKDEQGNQYIATTRGRAAGPSFFSATRPLPFIDVLTHAAERRQDGNFTSHEVEVLRTQALVTEKAMEKIMQLMAYLQTGQASPSNNQIRITPALQREYLTKLTSEARAIAQNPLSLCEPYLLPTTITNENFLQLGLTAAYFEALRRRQNRKVLKSPELARPTSATDKKMGEVFTGLATAEPSAESTIKRDLSLAEHERQKSIPLYDIESTGRLVLPPYAEETAQIVKPSRHPQTPSREVVANSRSDFKMLSLGSITVPHEGIVTLPTVENCQFKSVILYNSAGGSLVATPDMIRSTDSGNFVLLVPEEFRDKKFETLFLEFVAQPEKKLQLKNLEFDQPKAILKLREIIARSRRTSPGLEQLAQNLSKTIRIDPETRQEVLDVAAISTAINYSAVYLHNPPSTGFLDTKDPIPQLPQFIDADSGLLFLKCQTSAVICAYILGQVFQDEPNVEIALSSGICLYNETTENYQKSTLSAANLHAAARIRSHQQTVYLHPVPDYIAEESSDIGTQVQAQLIQGASADLFAENETIENSNMTRTIETRDSGIAIHEDLLKILRSRDYDGRLIQASLTDRTTPLPRIIRLVSSSEPTNNALHEIDEIKATIDLIMQMNPRDPRLRNIGLNNFHHYPELYLALDTILQRFRNVYDRKRAFSPKITN